MNMMKTLGRALLALTVMLTCMMNASVPAVALTSARVVTANFSAVGSGSSLLLRNGESFTYQVLSGQNGTQANKTVLQKSCDGSNFGDFSVPISTTNNSAGGTFTATIAAEPCASGRTWVRFQVTSYTSGASSTTLTEIDNVVQSLYNNSNESVLDVKDGGLVDNGYLSLSGYFRPQIKTKAQLVAIIPALGDVYTCSDCTHPYTLVIATGVAVDQFRESGLTTGVQ